MASYTVLSWRGIPSQVKATDETGASSSALLPVPFQQEIDRVAMVEGQTDTDAYLEGWAWSEAEESEGPAEDVAKAVAAEVAERWLSRNESTAG